MVAKFKTLFAKIPTDCKSSKTGDTYTVGDQAGLSAVDAAIHMTLCCYRAVLAGIRANTTMDVIQFITQLEANREYHARCCVVLMLIDKDTKIPAFDADLTVETMDPLRVFIHGISLTLSPYDIMHITTHIMVEMAKSEGPMDPNYVTGLIASNSNLPSHIRLLGQLLGNKPEDFAQHYPGSLMMNYANFYPFVLYPTGKPPTP